MLSVRLVRGVVRAAHHHPCLMAACSVPMATMPATLPACRLYGSGSVTPFLLGSRHGKQTLTTDDRPQITEEEIAEKRAASAKKRLKNREWLCDDCGNWNFGRRCDCFQLKPIAFICNVFVVPWGRTECNRCSKPRPAGAGRKPQGAATRLTTSTAQWSDEPGPRAAGSLKTCERGPPLMDSHAYTHAALTESLTESHTPVTHTPPSACAHLPVDESLNFLSIALKMGAVGSGEGLGAG